MQFLRRPQFLQYKKKEINHIYVFNTANDPYTDPNLMAMLNLLEQPDSKSLIYAMIGQT